jgi:hypothetical protein
MNLNDLMEVWRAQDEAPLHGVNETLLRLALRQDEAKLRAQRRRDEWLTYLLSAFLIAVMGFFFLIMIHPNAVLMTGWDLAIPIVGAAAALLWGVAAYVSRRAQAKREQCFGESLRDQLRRHIAQLDYQEARVFRLASVLLTWLPPVVCVTAFSLASMRVNSEPDEPFDDWPTIVAGIVTCALCWVVSVWELRRLVKRDVLPRKRRLEALLQELEAP